MFDAFVCEKLLNLCLKFLNIHTVIFQIIKQSTVLVSSKNQPIVSLIALLKVSSSSQYGGSNVEEDEPPVVQECEVAIVVNLKEK